MSAQAGKIYDNSNPGARAVHVSLAQPTSESPDNRADERVSLLGADPEKVIKASLTGKPSKD